MGNDKSGRPTGGAVRWDSPLKDSAAPLGIATVMPWNASCSRSWGRIMGCGASVLVQLETWWEFYAHSAEIPAGQPVFEMTEVPDSPDFQECL
jgi:hypothetical protein